MGFKFRKSVKIAPGVKLNLNKKSAGISIGGKGAHYTVNSKGKRTTSVGVPGTGVYYSSSKGGKSKGKNSSGGSVGSIGCFGFIVIFVIFAFIMAGIQFLKANPKIGIAVACIFAAIVALVVFLVLKKRKEKKLSQVTEAEAVTATEAEAVTAAEAERAEREERSFHAELKDCYSPESQRILGKVYRNKHSDTFNVDLSFEVCEDCDPPTVKVLVNEEYVGIINDNVSKLLRYINIIESSLFDVRSHTEDGEQMFIATLHIKFK